MLVVTIIACLSYCERLATAKLNPMIKPDVPSSILIRQNGEIVVSHSHAFVGQAQLI